MRMVTIDLLNVNIYIFKEKHESSPILSLSLPFKPSQIVFELFVGLFDSCSTEMSSVAF